MLLVSFTPKSVDIQGFRGFLVKNYKRVFVKKYHCLNSTKNHTYFCLFCLFNFIGTSAYRRIIFSHTKCRRAAHGEKSYGKITENPFFGKIFSKFSLYFVFRVFSNRNLGVIMFWV